MSRSRRNKPTYAAGSNFIVYQDGRHLDRDWAERMRAYHVGQLATPGISAERLQNNQRWLAEIDAAVAATWPEPKESAA